MSTARPMTRWSDAAASSALLLALPLAVLAVLRLMPPLTLSAPSWFAWSPPVAAAIIAVGAAAAMLAALFGGLHSGSLAAFLNAAGMGMLSGTYAIEAATGPGSAASVPSGASAIGGALAAILLLSAAVFGARKSKVTGARGRALAALAVFVLADLGIGLAALGLTDTLRRPEETALRLAAASLLGATAVLVNRHARHALSPALLGVGMLVLASARIGSLDVLIALAALLAGLASFVAQHGGAALRDERLPVQPAPPAVDLAPTTARLADERADPERLARELHGTIDELIQARRAISLQRVELERAATVDDLTAVASRSNILQRLRFEAAEARRYDHPVAVLLLDIDGLGAVNRDHGLTIGDAVLREVALRLRLRVREADAIGRAGDDCFLAILPHTDERGAAVFADTLRQRIGHREILTDAGALEVTVSIGVAIVRRGSDLSDEDVLANAVEALTSARAAGGDRIAFDRAHGLARIEERREAHRSDLEAAQDSGA